jgi:hypothetical protein
MRQNKSGIGRPMPLGERNAKKLLEDCFTVFTRLKIFSNISRLFSPSFLEIQ